MLRAFWLLLLLPLLGACADGEPTGRAAVRTAMLNDLADHVVAPAHLRFAERADALAEAVAALEQNPTEATLTEAQAAWLAAAQQWQRLDALNVPAVRFGLYHNRIATWPTRTDLVERALGTDEEITVEVVGRYGSNARGLPGLEYLLFGEEEAAALAALQQDPQRRAYARAVAADVAAQAHALETAWSPDGGDLLGQFVAADTEGRNLQSSISRLVNEMVMVAEDLRHERLGRPLGVANAPDETGGDPRPDLVQAPYAEASNALFLQSLEGLRAFVTADGHTGLGAYLATLDAQADAEPFAAVLLAQIDATADAVEALDRPLHDAVVENPDAVRAAYDETGELVRLLKADLAGWLGVSITFSDNDGD